MPSSKTRAFNCVLYCPEDFLRDTLDKRWPQIDWYAWIVHDRDFLDPLHPDDGVKKWHIHLVLYVKYPVTQTTIKNWFHYEFYDEESDRIREDKVITAPCYNLSGACRYLMHLDNPTKYPYPMEDVHTNKEDFPDFIRLDEGGGDPIRDCVRDLLDGWSIEDVMDKYGKLFVMYRKQITMTVSDLRYERQRRKNFEIHCMEVLADDYGRDYQRYNSQERLSVCDYGDSYKAY